MSILNDLKDRGFIAATTDEALEEHLETGSRTIYIGFDPTADSLHLGHLVPIMVLAHLQRAGHKVLMVVGGATGMIGDPSGKSDERNLLTAEQIDRNVAAVREQLARFVSFEGDCPAEIVNNFDWIGSMSFIDWLREVGKYFTINYMVAKESVKQRMAGEAGISYTEFSYMTLQAYDFLHLFREAGCTIQGGGNDQWGNITAGTDLIRKAEPGAKVFGVTFPLLTTSRGEKFGKTAGNAVWLDADRTSPYQLYQYWIRSEDADVETFLKLFTFLSMDEIAAIMAEHNEAPERRTAQKALAEHATRLIHGDGGRAKAVAASGALFGGDLSALGAGELKDIFADVPSTTMDRAALADGLGVLDLFAATGLAKSKGEARKKIAQGGVYVNNERVTDVDATIDAAGLLADELLVLRMGKKQYHLVLFA
jgi:tyrosyl-tRNA synthetase